ncbi:MAG: hypothetical protein LBS60_05400 [Deltaproteobacteria bacterium]|jgi:hypothetical protein|nr:hypothetical protein [Deltaproteobacteria bacterium]
MSSVDPLAAYMAARGIAFSEKLTPLAPSGLTLAVAVQKTGIGPLPGSETLFVLTISPDRELLTVKEIDLAAYGLDESLGGAQDIATFRRNLKAVLAELKGVTLTLAKDYKGLLPHQLLTIGVDRLVKAEAGLASLPGLISHLFSPEGLDEDEEPNDFELKGPGEYLVDLTAVLARDPDQSSKTVLKPFLTGREFKRLIVKFGHEPRWLAAEAKSLGLDYAVQTDASETIVILTKKA